MNAELWLYGTIILLALVTYATRITGFWLAKYLKLSPKINELTRHLPGCILISMVTPAIVSKGPVECFAAIVTAFAAFRWHNLFASIAIGLFALVTAKAVIAGGLFL